MCSKEEIKMKVMVGLFTTESNANVPGKNEIGSYDLGFGDDCVRKRGSVRYSRPPGST